MKKNTLTKHIIVIMMCLIPFISIGKTASFESMSFDSACCDSTLIYTVSDSTQIDTCTGFVYFQFSSDTNCIVKGVIATGILDSLVWDTTAKAYKGRYGIHTGDVLVITGYFIDIYGDTICTKAAEISCDGNLSCCDSTLIYTVSDSTQIDTCTGFTYFQFSNDPKCIVTGVIAIGILDSLVWDSTALAYKGRYAIPIGHSLVITGYFMDIYGDTICTKSVEVNCPGDSCCLGIEIVDTLNSDDPGGPCCGTLIIHNNGECTIADIGFEDVSNPSEYFKKGSSMYEYIYCIHNGTTLRVVFYFMNVNGDTICTKLFQKDCGDVQHKTGKIIPHEDYMGSLMVFVSPNPTSNKLNVMVGYASVGDVTYEVLNLNGQRVLEYTGTQLIRGNNEHTFDLSGLASGIYIMKVGNGENTQHLKFVVAK